VPASAPTRTKYGVSPWIDQFPKKRRPEFPKFRGAATYPVVIVGGGLSGCFTAYAFAAAGVKVALVEAERVGFSGAGRGAGVLQGEAAPSYRDVEARYGRRAARLLFDASRRAVLDLATAARRLGINNVETTETLRVLASYGADEKALLKDIALRRDAGLEAVWLKSSAAVRDSRVESARAAVRLRGWGTASPYELVTTFVQAATKRGAAVFERSPVRKIKVRRKDVEIHAAGGILTANTIVVATGEPTDLYRSLKRHVQPDERYLVLTDRLPVPIRRQVHASVRIISDTDTPPHLLRWTDDGRMLIAGADQPRTSIRIRDKVVVQRTGQLMYELSRMYPAISGVMPSYGWDQPVGRTADGIMFAGPHRNYPRHLFAWATRHDPSQAFLASRILLRNYLGRPDREDAFFAFTRG
jgi:glycine/D-amino acid oxidase-like deaminating enzyme